MCIAVFVRACVCMYVKWGKVEGGGAGSGCPVRRHLYFSIG